MGQIFKIIILILSLSALTYAQAYMGVDTNGVTVTYDLADIDSITFNNVGDTMNVDITSGTDIYNLAEIDSVTFSGDTTGKTIKVKTREGTVDYNLSEVASISYELLYYDSTGTVTDIDGNVYKTVKIGDQWWMAENLKVTHYRNGEVIPFVINYGDWSNSTTGVMCYYNNDYFNSVTYGCLYNWYAVDSSSNIAPAGWHVPSDNEWKQLEMYLGMSQSMVDAIGWRGFDEGGKMKEADTTHWRSPNTGATNVSGFTALPGGYRYYNGFFYVLGEYGYWWSSTWNGAPAAWGRMMGYVGGQVRRDYFDNRHGYSIRCVKD